MAFVHEDVLEPAQLCVFQQPQRELLEVMEIEHGFVAFARRISAGEFLRQAEQRFHMTARPFPVFAQRIARGDRVQKLGTIAETAQRLLELLCPVWPLLLNDWPQARRDLLPVAYARNS